MINKNIYLSLFYLLFIFACGERYYNGESQTINKEVNQELNLEETSKPSRSDNNEIKGKVIKIADGDTFTLIFDNNFEVRVRLNGIDCPEKKQAFSDKAKQALSDLIFSKMVSVAYEDKDRYGRVLGEVFVDDVNVNQEMVKKGFAWHFKRYSDDPTLAQLEQEARMNRVGLWSDQNPIAPWEFRKR